jgi:hypothetical protein
MDINQWQLAGLTAPKYRQNSSRSYEPKLGVQHDR